MWFLQTGTLLRILAMCVVMGAASCIAARSGKQRAVTHLLILPDFLILFSISVSLAVFYAAYIVGTFLLILALGRMRRGRKPWFVIMCLLCTIPFFYNRATEYVEALPALAVMTGIAYQMLKAIDALFYVYYTDEKIPLLTYANYMAFVPVLTAGPIFRYRDFLATYENPLPINAENVAIAVKRCIRGLFKKLVLLYVVNLVYERCLAASAHWYVSLAVILLSYVIFYLDMSGYADIAIALSLSMGIRAPENFHEPWTAASMTQFWRKWHISLSDWIRDHIFVTLAGRKLTRRQGAWVNFFTMIFMSMWQGFSIPMLLYGVYMGVIMAVEALLGIASVNKRKMRSGVYLVRCIATNLLFAFGAFAYSATVPQIGWLLRGFISL